MKLFLLSCVLLGALHSCGSVTQSAKRYYECNSIIDEISNKTISYRDNRDMTLLNQVMILADSGYKYCTGCISVCGFVFSKAEAYWLSGRYDDGIEYVISVPDSVFIFGYEKNYLINMLNAHKSISVGDTIAVNMYVKEVVDEMRSCFEGIDHLNFGNLEVLIYYYRARAVIEVKNKLIGEVERREISEAWKRIIIDWISVG